MGGYFICNGIERIIRMLIQQRRHYIMGLRRSAYHKRGNNYTDAATLIRCTHCRGSALSDCICSSTALTEGALALAAHADLLSLHKRACHAGVCVQMRRQPLSGATTSQMGQPTLPSLCGGRSFLCRWASC